MFPSTNQDSTTTGKLVFRWIDGRFVTERSFTLSANEQIVGLFMDLLPEARDFSSLDLAGGSVEVTFDKPVAVVAVHIFSFTGMSSSEDDFEWLYEPLFGHLEIQP